MDEKSLEALQAYKQRFSDTKDMKERVKFDTENTKAIIETMTKIAEAFIKYSDGSTKKVSVQNPVESVSTPDVKDIAPRLEKVLGELTKAVKANKPLTMEKLESLLQGMIDATDKLPKEFPKVEFPKLQKVEVVNPIDNSDLLKEINDSVNKLELVSSPQITLPEPQVKVARESQTLINETRNLAGLLTQLLEKEIPVAEVTSVEMAVAKVEQAINELRFPIPPAFPRTIKVTNPDGSYVGTSSEYASKITTADPYTYVAEAEPGTAEATAAWRVRRVESGATDTTVTWADGNNNFDNVATDLTTLTYS